MSPCVQGWAGANMEEVLNRLAALELSIHGLAEGLASTLERALDAKLERLVAAERARAELAHPASAHFASARGSLRRNSRGRRSSRSPDDGRGDALQTEALRSSRRSDPASEPGQGSLFTRVDSDGSRPGSRRTGSPQSRPASPTTRWPGSPFTNFTRSSRAIRDDKDRKRLKVRGRRGRAGCASRSASPSSRRPARSRR